MFRRVARRASALTVLLGIVSVFWVIPIADAAYPGANGDIAFSSTRNSNIALYQVDPSDPNLGSPAGDQSATSELTLGGADVEPFYTPDGKTVYFSSDRDAANVWVIYSVPQGAFPSGSKYATGDDANPDWSPNGQQVVFNSTRGGGDTLFIIDLTTTPPTGYPIWSQLAAPNQTISTEPVFSPDGT